MLTRIQKKTDAHLTTYQWKKKQTLIQQRIDGLNGKGTSRKTNVEQIEQLVQGINEKMGVESSRGG